MILSSKHVTLRFKETNRSFGISQRMLSRTLRGLERDGLVNRRYYPTIPSKMESGLTPMGISFQNPILSSVDFDLDAVRRT